MMRLCLLGSGSSGNCVYIGDGGGALLLDAGFSAKETLGRMNAAGLDPATVKAIVISHEHGDHVRGAGPLSRKLGVPVYMNEPTHGKIKNVIGKTPGVEIFETGQAFSVNGLSVTPFSISHDGADPCAFVLGDGNRRAAVLTDVGHVTRLVEERVRDVDYLVVEANHDYEMLMAGPYPWPLKQRVASRLGHLSNEACATFLEGFAHANLQGVALAHISRTNNNADLVRLMAGDTLGGGAPFIVASQDAPTQVVTVE